MDDEEELERMLRQRRTNILVGEGENDEIDERRYLDAE